MFSFRIAVSGVVGVVNLARALINRRARVSFFSFAIRVFLFVLIFHFTLSTFVDASKLKSPLPTPCSNGVEIDEIHLFAFRWQV